MADDTKPTKTVKYSWNEGLTWEYLTFSDEEIDVSNIIIEPMNMALKFLMYGKKTNLESGSEGVIFFLDFSTLKQRVCSGLWNPGAEESDYEIWIPGSMEEKKCLFGKRMKYVRRKRNAYCFNGEDYEKKNIVDFCPCVEEDWECDFGFYRKEGSKDCVPISSEFEHKLNNFTEPENCTDYYEVPSGYRKIPGDYCVGGIDKLLAKQIRCSKSSSSYVSVKGNIDSKQSNQNIEDTQLPWGKIKIAVFSILFFALIYIFREDFIKLLVNALSLVKKIGRKRNDDNRRDYERVGAPLNNMNDDEEDEDNI